MRVIRTILGILLLTVGLPLLLAGGGLWMAMQHRDAGGAFSGDLEDIDTSGYAVVVPDVDALLRREAPFARSEQTRLRLVAHTARGEAFIGMAPQAEAAKFLAGVAHTRVDEVKLTRGSLPVRAVPVSGEAEPATGPKEQRFWVRSGTGALEWDPAVIRGRHLALVVMAASGEQPGVVMTTAELRPGWLGSSTWGLLVLGSLMLLLGILLLGWPARSREVVYVVEPSQVPDIAARLGVPVPSLGGSGTAGSEQPGSRPATLAESAAVEATTAPWAGPVSPPAVPRLSWPPVPTARSAATPAVPGEGTSGETATEASGESAVGETAAATSESTAGAAIVAGPGEGTSQGAVGAVVGKPTAGAAIVALPGESMSGGAVGTAVGETTAGAMIGVPGEGMSGAAVTAAEDRARANSQAEPANPADPELRPEPADPVGLSGPVEAGAPGPVRAGVATGPNPAGSSKSVVADPATEPNPAAPASPTDPDDAATGTVPDGAGSRADSAVPVVRPDSAVPVERPEAAAPNPAAEPVIPASRTEPAVPVKRAELDGSSGARRGPEAPAEPAQPVGDSGPSGVSPSGDRVGDPIGAPSGDRIGALSGDRTGDPAGEDSRGGSAAGTVPTSGGGPGTVAPPQVVPPRTARRRRNMAAEQGQGIGEPGQRRGAPAARTEVGRTGETLEAPTGAGIGAAVAAGRRPTRPRGVTKPKPPKDDAEA